MGIAQIATRLSGRHRRLNAGHHRRESRIAAVRGENPGPPVARGFQPRQRATMLRTIVGVVGNVRSTSTDPFVRPSSPRDPAAGTGIRCSCGPRMDPSLLTRSVADVVHHIESQAPVETLTRSSGTRSHSRGLIDPRCRVGVVGRAGRHRRRRDVALRAHAGDRRGIARRHRAMVTLLARRFAWCPSASPSVSAPPCCWRSLETLRTRRAARSVDAAEPQFHPDDATAAAYIPAPWIGWRPSTPSASTSGAGPRRPASLVCPTGSWRLTASPSPARRPRKYRGHRPSAEHHERLVDAVNHVLLARVKPVRMNTAVTTAAATPKLIDIAAWCSRSCWRCWSRRRRRPHRLA